MSKVRLDEENCYMWVDDRMYVYKEVQYSYLDPDADSDEERHWYKTDKRFAVSADSEDPKHKIPVDETYDMLPEEWVYLRVRIKDRDKVRKLNRRFEKALARVEAKEKAEKDAKKREREEEEAKQRRYREESEASEREHERWERRSEKATQSSDSEESKDVARTKWGTKITSNDRKHYFNIGVWESTGYEGCSTVRISVAGRTCMYTLDKTQMKALRREISRGVPT